MIELGFLLAGILTYLTSFIFVRLSVILFMFIFSFAVIAEINIVFIAIVSSSLIILRSLKKRVNDEF